MRQNSTTKLIPPPNPSGLCMCGCGQPAPIAKKTSRREGTVAGYPQRYLIGHSRRLSPVPYLIVDHGYETPCWEWQWTVMEHGYGIVRDTDTGRTRRAHILYWERENGPVPDGFILDHLCRIRRCVNPSHLEPVTHAENLRRGKGTRLRREQVDQIRMMFLEMGGRYGSQATIARATGVSTGMVCRIVRGKLWR